MVDAVPGALDDQTTETPGLNEAALAEQARAVAQQRVRRQAKNVYEEPPVDEPTQPLAPPTAEHENPFAKWATPEARTVGLAERARLNAVEGYYRGTLFGSSRLAAMAHEARQPDTPDMTPDDKKARKRMRKEYTDVIADLARYDSLTPWGNSVEGAVAFAGTLGGTALSPESWLGAEAGGPNLWWRTAKAALQQGAISVTADPLIQAMNINAGAQKDYDAIRTIMQGGMGAVIGGGLHLAGEVVGSSELRMLKRAMAAVDPEARDIPRTTLEEDLAQARREALEAPHSADTIEPVKPGAEPPPTKQAANEPAYAKSEQEVVTERAEKGEAMVPPPETPPTGVTPEGLSETAQRALDLFRQNEDKIGVSFMQRQLGLKNGPARAAMDELQKAGFVSEADHKGKHTLLKPEEKAAAPIIPEAKAPPERPLGYPEDAPTELFRGEGRAEKGAVYGGPAVPIAGEGRYFSFSEEGAKEFGPNITKSTLGDEVQKPLIITDGRQWNQITKEAGWEFPNPSGRPEEEVKALTAKLKELVEKKGHDGLVVWWDDKIEKDIGPNGENLKLLRAVFGEPQIVSYNAPVKVIRPKRKQKIDERKLSILQYLAFHGGINEGQIAVVPELRKIFESAEGGGKIDNPFIPRMGSLFRKEGGMTFDEAVQQLAAGKFLVDHPDAAAVARDQQTAHNKVLEMIAEEKRGNRQYAVGREPAPKTESQAERQHYIEARAKEMMDNVQLDPKTREELEKRVVELIDKEGETSARQAIDTAALEATDKDLGAEARREITGDVKGYDVDDAGAAFETGERPPTEEPGVGESARVPSVEATEAGQQLVLPGGEQSAVQLAASREAEGRGKLKAGAPQKEEAGPLFAPGETAQDLLFTRQAGPTTGRPAAGAPQAPPPPPVTPPLTPKDQNLRSLQQLAFDLAEKLGIELRTGRVEAGAVGQYSTKSGVARVKDATDIEVVAHELGHGLEDRIGKPLTDIIRTHDTELSVAYLTPEQRAKLDPASRMKEGFAEYMRNWIDNPANAAKVAPGFHGDFERLMMRDHPDFWRALNATQTAYVNFNSTNSVHAVGAVIRSRADEPQGWAKIADNLSRAKLPKNITNVMQRMYEGVLDQTAPMTRVVYELAGIWRKMTGTPLDIKAADNPAILIRFYQRTMQPAMHQLMDGIRPAFGWVAEGPSPRGALMHATGQKNPWGNWDDNKVALFLDYIVARMGEVMWDRYAAGELRNFPVPFSRGDAVQAQAEILKQFPTFEKAGDMLHEWNLRYAKRMYDYGHFTPELYKQALLQKFYVPMFRDMSDKPAASAVGAGGMPEGMSDLIKRMRGSRRDIKNPLESMMLMSFLYERTIMSNLIRQKLLQLSEKVGVAGGKYVERLPAHEAKMLTFPLQDTIERIGKEKGVDPHDLQRLLQGTTDLFGEDPVIGSIFRMEKTRPHGEPLVWMREGGNLVPLRVMTEEGGHDLFALLTQMPQDMTDWFAQLVGQAASIKRAGIILNPTFALTNYIRDQFATAILYRRYIPIVSGLRGIAEEYTEGQHSALYSYAGGVAGGALTGAIDRAAEADINALARRGFGVIRIPTLPRDMASFKSGLKDVAELVSVTEAGTRNSIFKMVFDQKRKEGLSGYEAMWEAAHQAQDILDFGRHGSRMQTISRMLPFLNAHMQGLDKGWRTIVQPVLEKMKDKYQAGGVRRFASDDAEFNNAIFSLVKAGGVGSILGAVWAALMWDHEGYRDASPYLKGTHVVIPFGNKIAVLPKPFELSLGFTLGEYAFAAIAKDDPRAAGQFMEAANQALQPPNPLTDIPLISTIMQLKLGRSAFTGRDIVPDDLARLEPSQQFTPGTSSFAKSIGKTIGVSPMKVDFAIGDFFGTWGRDLMTLSSAIDENNPAHNWEDRVFSRRFIKDPGRTSDATTKYWDYMRRTTGKFNQDVATYQMFLDRNQDDQAKDFMNKLPRNEQSFVIVNKAADSLGRPAFDADEKRVHPLQRSYNALQVLNGLRQEVNQNNVTRTVDKSKVPLTDIQRRDLLDALRELGQMEMRNGLVILNEPGYQGRPLMDIKVPFEKIRRISPELADEVANRYATANVYTTKAVAAAWPQYRDELVKNGSSADIRGLSFEVRGEGYEFGAATRLHKPPKRRIVVEPGTTGLGR